MLCLDDLQAVAADIKNTLSAAISDLRLDIQATATRLEEVEEMTARHDTAIQEVQQATTSRALLL